MHRFFGEQDAYSLFNTLAFFVLFFSSLFLFKIKKDKLGLFSNLAVFFCKSKSERAGKIALIVLTSLESLILAETINLSTFFNHSFGNAVGTGANYFATLFLAPVLMIVVSLLILANPIKQIDIFTMLLPLYLTPVRLACYFNGCCWGIPWEHGPYNYHNAHPGNQVPVQAIEAGFAFLIFLFLLWYRKKAKPGTMYPMYMILYGGARFFNEFFTADYPAVLGPFKVYHFLCTISFVVGLILFFIMRKYGEKILDLFDKMPYIIKEKIANYKEQKALAVADAEAQAEIAEIERKEKIRLARERAKARKK